MSQGFQKQQFPLYDTLMANLPKKDLTVLQKAEFMKKVAALDVKAYQLMFILIFFYLNEHPTSPNLSIPFETVVMQKQATFDLLSFPVELRQLLFKFVSVHSQKLVEDAEIKVLQTPDLSISSSLLESKQLEVPKKDNKSKKKQKK